MDYPRPYIRTDLINLAVPIALIFSWCAWLGTMGQPFGFLVLVNYLALGVGVAATTWLVAHWLGTPRTRTILACIAAVVLAWIWWGKLDSYEERRHHNEEDVSVTTIETYQRFGGTGFRHISAVSPGGLASREGPLDQYRQQHGKWRYIDSHWKPPVSHNVTDHWFYRGQEVSAIEWQAMRAD